MAVNDDKCKQRRMMASCVPDCWDEIHEKWLHTCKECDLSGEMIK